MDVTVLASGSSGNCYRISDGSTAILLDAGISISRIRRGCRFDLASISGCFVSHFHGDHSRAVNDLMHVGVPVFMTEGEMKAGGFQCHCLFRDFEDGSYQEVYCGTFAVIPFGVQHDTPEPVGFFVQSSLTGERLLYFTDTFYIRQRFAPFDYLIGECNYDEETLEEHIKSRETGAYRAKRLFSSHMSLSNFLQFLKANDISRLKKIWICHMSDDHGNAERIKEAVQKETGVPVEVC